MSYTACGRRNSGRGIQRAGTQGRSAGRKAPQCVSWYKKVTYRGPWNTMSVLLASCLGHVTEMNLKYQSSNLSLCQIFSRRGNPGRLEGRQILVPHRPQKKIWEA